VSAEDPGEHPEEPPAMKPASSPPAQFLTRAMLETGGSFPERRLASESHGARMFQGPHWAGIYQTCPGPGLMHPAHWAGAPHPSLPRCAEPPPPYHRPARAAGEGKVPGRACEGRGHRGWHESTLLSRQPRRDHECRGLCTRLVDELCINAGSRCGARRRARGDPGGPTPGYQDGCRWQARWREDPEGIASVPAPDSYPHVTCG
jgi:hypothetical protein